MSDKIYPLKNNHTFYTFLHNDYKEVVCKRDYPGRIFIEDKTYKFRKAKHNFHDLTWEEIEIDVWVVWSGINNEPHYFMTSTFRSYFYVEQLLREEKLNELGIV